jgi:hypothetical protein
MAEPLLLIAGIPASCKTFFSEWLESTKGFLYLDIDKDPSMRLAGLESEWQYCLQNNDASRFRDKLLQRPQPIVLEWGFPPRFLSIIEGLKLVGFSIWWFDTKYEIARIAFIQRGTIPLYLFENQMQGIKSNWVRIEAVFSPNIITTLDENGKHISVENIYHRIIEVP